MIAVLILFGLAAVALTLPARAFGWGCGDAVRLLLRDGRPSGPTPPALRK